MKKTIFFFIFNILLIKLHTTTISSIDNIIFNRKSLDYDYYDSTLHIYENKLIVNRQYSVQEYLILENGDLSLLHTIQSKSTSIENSFISDGLLYRYVNLAVTIAYQPLFIEIIDLTTTPMSFVTRIELPMLNNYVASQAVFDDYIWFSCYTTQRT